MDILLNNTSVLHNDGFYSLQSKKELSYQDDYCLPSTDSEQDYFSSGLVTNEILDSPTVDSSSSMDISYGINFGDNSSDLEMRDSCVPPSILYIPEVFEDFNNSYGNNGYIATATHSQDSQQSCHFTNTTIQQNIEKQAQSKKENLLRYSKDNNESINCASDSFPQQHTKTDITNQIMIVEPIPVKEKTEQKAITPSASLSQSTKTTNVKEKKVRKRGHKIPPYIKKRILQIFNELVLINPYEQIKKLAVEVDARIKNEYK